jgi:hypothetical protein
MILLEQAGEVDLGRTREAWKQFVKLGDVRGQRVRPHVVRAWQRSVAGGCSPYMMKADVLSPRESSALLSQEHPLIDAARPFMAALSRAAGHERHAAMLGDRAGRVLDVLGDEASVHGPEAVQGPAPSSPRRRRGPTASEALSVRGAISNSSEPSTSSKDFTSSPAKACRSRAQEGRPWECSVSPSGASRPPSAFGMCSSARPRRSSASSSPGGCPRRPFRQGRARPSRSDCVRT